jgi:hypothetical protein
VAQPVSTLTLGGTDITNDCLSPDGDGTAKWGRGAAFDLGAEAPGYAVFRVRNDAKKYNPDNASSPVFASLKPGTTVRLTSVYSATTYYNFHGFLRRIVPLPAIKMAELHCQDVLFNLSRKEVNLAASFSRTISAFRAAVLTDAGESVSNRNLAVGNGAEGRYSFTAADQRPALDILNDLNAATGTIHYVKPTSSAYEYTTVDRLALQSSSSSETWSDTDFANAFASELQPYDYTDEGVINSQRVRASPRLISNAPSVVWERGWSLKVPASSSKTIWAKFDDPAFNQYLSYTSVGVTPAAVTLTPFSRSAKITVTAAAGGMAELRDLMVVGDSAPVVDLGSYLAEDATSISSYGRLRGGEISSDYLSNLDEAEALANYIVWRYSVPRGRPAVTFTDRFPTQLVREVGERITLTSSELSLSAAPMWIRKFETVIRNGHWTTTYDLEQAPAALDLVQVGGDAAHGIGSAATLGY